MTLTKGKPENIFFQYVLLLLFTAKQLKKGSESLIYTDY